VKNAAAKGLLYLALFMIRYPYFPHLMFGLGEIWYLITAHNTVGHSWVSWKST